MPTPAGFDRTHPITTGEWTCTPRKTHLREETRLEMFIQVDWRNWASTLTHNPTGRTVHVEHVYPADDGFEHLSTMRVRTCSLTHSEKFYSDCTCSPEYSATGTRSDVIIVQHRYNPGFNPAWGFDG
jgi:hypothetical protein